MKKNLKEKKLKLRKVHYSKLKPLTDRMALYHTRKGWKTFFTVEDLKKMPNYVTLIPKEAYINPHEYCFPAKGSKRVR